MSEIEEDNKQNACQLLAKKKKYVRKGAIVKSQTVGFYHGGSLTLRGSSNKEHLTKTAHCS